MKRSLTLIAMVGVLAGCNFAPAPQGDVSPTVELIEMTQVEAPTLTPSLTPTMESVTVTLIVETAIPTDTPGPPTLPPPPTDTPGPYEHTIRQNETLGAIIQFYGYRDFSIIDEIVRINDNVPNADRLPGEGSVILIPRQTETPLPDDFTPVPDIGIAVVAPTSASTGLNIDAPIIEHSVMEGQTIVDIAVQHSTTLEVLAVLNQEVSFAGCNFEIPSGGPNCGPLLRVGQVLRVPAPTPTPTLSPTPSGNETATPTPTYAAPAIISPPQDASVPAGVFYLEWVSAGLLQPDEVYLVQINDQTTGQVFHDITRSTSMQLPASMMQADGQVHQIQWTVSVAKPNVDGIYQVVSGSPEVRKFNWLSP